MGERQQHGNLIRKGEFRDHETYQTDKITYLNLPDYMLDFEELKSS